MAAKAKDGLGSVRSVLKRWTTPLLPDDYTQLINPLWSIRELRGQIVSVTKHNDDTVSLVIRPGWGVPVEFNAGQYIGIGVQIDGRYTWRSYSLTNAPRPDKGVLSITVRAVEKGKLSNHLVGTAQEGMQVRLAAPAGDFHLTDPVPEKLLFITAGTGITPVMSMLRTLAERDQLGDVVLVHSTRNRENFLFESEVAKMSEKNPQFVRHLRVTSEEGRLTPQDIEKLVPDFAQRAPYACGPSEMLDALEQWWDSHGAPEELRTERFTLDRASDAEGGEITFGDRASVDVDGATTILEAAESVGVQLPFGCRMGICQTCVQQVDEGHALNLRTGEIHEPGSRIRVCVCVASGNLKFDV